MTEFEGRPRALHPAVWTRRSGEKVLHVSPWMAKGIEGREDADGDALLAAVCDEIVEAAEGPQLLPSLAADRHGHLGQLALPPPVSGMAPEHARCMHRTTIAGDYGLGRFEAEPPADH